MATFPDGGGLGDPHDADRDGLLYLPLNPIEKTPDPSTGGLQTYDRLPLRS